ncbi:MAG TPA: putative lipid II flippase FtsW [Desulfotomaculum sp.]|nr:MAG: Cell division protein FtsW [Desulfotomaculum sp. 46_80]HAG11658.1 putative lipid II flippase FtsW [Desulfotomaculum sp.]HBY05069.1 putative lipid II flippase FtsW [Desulfotomaculum sp.]
MRTRRSPDFILLLVLLILLGLGIVMVFSSSLWYATLPPFNDTFYFFRKQLIWAIIGLAAMFAFMNYDYWRLKRWASLLLIAGLALLAVVLIPHVGVVRQGAQRWLNLGPLSFQPAEFVKLCLVVFTAFGLSRQLERVKNSFIGILPFLLLAALSGGLILLEPDLGTAVTVVGTIFIMLFAAGARMKDLAVIGLFGAVALGGAIWKEPYRLKRFLAFLDPEKDPQGTGWHILNSLMSLGSGGLLGTGLGRGHAKYLWVPERHTDFIFAIIGEELGFIGAGLVILLFIILIWRGFRAAVTAPDSFGALLATGIISGIAVQVIINIGVVTSSLPITGITLPFISFGGSSLVFSLASMGILLNISRFSVNK